MHIPEADQKTEVADGFFHPPQFTTPVRSQTSEMAREAHSRAAMVNLRRSRVFRLLFRRNTQAKDNDEVAFPEKKKPARACISVHYVCGVAAILSSRKVSDLFLKFPVGQILITETKVLPGKCSMLTRRIRSEKGETRRILRVFALPTSGMLRARCLKFKHR